MVVRVSLVDITQTCLNALAEDLRHSALESLRDGGLHLTERRRPWQPLALQCGPAAVHQSYHHGVGAWGHCSRHLADLAQLLHSQSQVFEEQLGITSEDIAETNNSTLPLTSLLACKA